MARLLLKVAVMTLTGCPIPDYEVDPQDNRPIQVRDDLVAPPEGAVAAVRSCPSTIEEFRIGPAISDPDDDRLFVFWFVDFTEGEQGVPDDDGPDFDLDPCNPTIRTEDSVLVEAVVMDRPPVGFDAQGARQTTDDGDLVILRWFVEIAEGTCCEG
ncbi:MAG: hypothetical protein ACQEXJ_20015 [Myxococcota bacterium]